MLSFEKCKEILLNNPCPICNRKNQADRHGFEKMENVNGGVLEDGQNKRWVIIIHCHNRKQSQPHNPETLELEQMFTRS